MVSSKSFDKVFAMEWETYAEPAELAEMAEMEARIALLDGERRRLAQQLRAMRDRAKHRARRGARPRSAAERGKSPGTLPQASATLRLKLCEEIERLASARDVGEQADLLGADLQLRLPSARVHLTVDLTALGAGGLEVVGGWVEAEHALWSLSAGDADHLAAALPKRIADSAVSTWRSRALGAAGAG